MGTRNERASAAEKRGAKSQTAGPERAKTAGASTQVRQLRVLVALGVTFSALFTVCILVPTLFQEDDSVQTAQAEPLLGLDAADVAGISWSSADADVSLTLDNGIWKDAAEPEAELDQEAVEDLVEAVCAVEVERTIDADDVTDELGANDPTATATLTLEDGTETEVSLGAASADGSGSYAWVDDGDDAYLVDGTLAEAFSTTVADLYEQETGPQVATDDVVSLTVQRADSTLTLRYYPDGSDASYTDEYTWFADDGTGEQAADASSARTLVSLVNNVSWTACVDATYDSEADAATYGLDAPTLTVELAYTTEEGDEESEDEAEAVDGEATATDGEVATDGEAATDEEAATDGETTTETFTLVIGAQAENGDYYAQPQGSSRVYTVSASTVQQLLEATPASMLPDDVLLMDWDTVDSIDITYNGETHTLAITRSTAEDETATEAEAATETEAEIEAEAEAGEETGDEEAEGETGVDETAEETADEAADAVEETTYSVDGTEVLALKAENLLTALGNLSAEGEASDVADLAEAEISFTFHRSTESYAEMTFALIPYDNSFYLVSFNGEQRLLVNKNDVATIVGYYEDLFD